MDDEKYMALALLEARKAFDKGQFPVGCVIVDGNQVIATGSRTGTAGDQPFFSEISHAEILALRSLETLEAGYDQKKTTLYCTMEPCLMCYGAIILAGIKRIVYAYEDAMGGGTACDFTRMPPLYKNCEIEVVPGVLRQKSLDLFYKFFNKEANLYWKDSYLETYTRQQHELAGQEK